MAVCKFPVIFSFPVIKAADGFSLPAQKDALNLFFSPCQLETMLQHGQVMAWKLKVDPNT